ncbi:NAD(P)H-dependent oxidoreductase subunit E [Oryzobacter telluris]|uniref:NAD(P)H-dependent oxidoreductase subunit E n=1 Tax=Oryzobacter telluris TaxID=3149179 RepID=UPI00370D3B4A
MPKRGPIQAPTPAPADPVRAESVRAIAEQLAGIRGPLLPVLHEVVATHGYVTDDDVTVVAKVLNLSRADVHGTVTFYHDLRRTPPPAHRVSLCRGEACQARGGEALHADASDRWATDPDVEVGEVFCLGLCAQGPSGTLDGSLHAGLTPERLTEITQEWQR